MTRIKYHAIYATTDYNAARHYRINRSGALRAAHSPQHPLQEQSYLPTANTDVNKKSAEINESERKILLSNKAATETRQLLQP